MATAYVHAKYINESLDFINEYRETLGKINCAFWSEILKLSFLHVIHHAVSHGPTVLGIWFI